MAALMKAMPPGIPRRDGRGTYPIIREWEAEAEALWDEGELSAAQIADKFGVTKNTLLGIAHRRDWSPRGIGKYETVRTTSDRLNALHAMLDATLVECKKLMEVSRKKAAAGMAREYLNDGNQRDQAEDGIRLPYRDKPRRVGHAWRRPILVRVPGTGVR